MLVYGHSIEDCAIVKSCSMLNSMLTNDILDSMVMYNDMFSPHTSLAYAKQDNSCYKR